MLDTALRYFGSLLLAVVGAAAIWNELGVVGVIGWWSVVGLAALCSTTLIWVHIGGGTIEDEGPPCRGTRACGLVSELLEDDDDGLASKF